MGEFNCSGCQTIIQTAGFCSVCIDNMAKERKEGPQLPIGPTDDPTGSGLGLDFSWLPEYEESEYDLSGSSSAESTDDPPDALDPIDSSTNLLKDQMQAFESRFDKTFELEELWLRASEGASDYTRARENFWQLVNNDTSYEADYVRNMLEAAGFEPGTGTNAPMLSMEWDDKRETRMDAGRRLSIDHAIPQSRDSGLSIEPSNLRFMLQDDNSRRGARFNDDDRRYIDVCPGCWRPSQGGAKCDVCIRTEAAGPRYIPEV